MLNHDRRDEARGAHDIHEIDIKTGVPLLVGDFEQRRARTVPGGIDQRIDAAEFLHRQVNEALEIIHIQV